MPWKVHSADWTGEGKLHFIDPPNLHMIVAPQKVRLYLGDTDLRKCPIQLAITREGVEVVRWAWMRAHWPKLLRGLLHQLRVPSSLYEPAIRPAIEAATLANRVYKNGNEAEKE